jgi:hypothetical protein
LRALSQCVSIVLAGCLRPAEKYSDQGSLGRDLSERNERPRSRGFSAPCYTAALPLAPLGPRLLLPRASPNWVPSPHRNEQQSHSEPQPFREHSHVRAAAGQFPASASFTAREVMRIPPLPPSGIGPLREIGDPNGRKPPIFIGRRGDWVRRVDYLVRCVSRLMARLRHHAVPVGIPLAAPKRTCSGNTRRTGFDPNRSLVGVAISEASVGRLCPRERPRTAATFHASSSSIPPTIRTASGASRPRTRTSRSGKPIISMPAVVATISEITS